MTLKATSLQDLAPVRRALAEAAAQEALLQQQRAEAARRLLAEQKLFENTVGPVHALKSAHARHLHAPEPPEPLPLQLELDEQRVLQEAMSDEFDVSTLLDTDDQLSFRRPGIGLDVTHKLRAGQWSIQRQLDLHGLRVDEAREALGQFIRLSHRTGIRCVRVVHGKGLGSPGKTPVLKGRVLRWLVQKKEVLAFVQARPAEGGAGALVVLLQPGRRQLY
ncbi:Smr protein/MutS2 [Delftia acidovorans SPH-1]|jgi:DNA-nicking Smr family endonuclease|uniref:Smr protein/MutS2 n=1 Tax=Delftia acidovorans (strain DSM 14801 / SPH-1) TaxID=398578 RepID=A9BYK0_DELAS|nr:MULTISPECIES: Smr/MutS family protein [Delftia]ABX34543.1 Smr protein/MutS2 [Delftia acidovorans SPH-1]MDH0851061.1 Smr/MutS family protein [Delftia tsuruhatensis]MPT54917.1 DNA mismatch repair protein MutS [Delftia sp.]OLE08117.1 MAG: DNA mismatch repair protein MutS [Delftia sp. 13_1_20CM_4_67_18]OWG15343.1 DNA mismatch repair protein MutS [Delftia sp. K82]